MRPSSSHKATVGFSIIELLIAIIIIGILVSIIIPVLLRRTDDARLAGAESDLEHLQGAEERAHINTGYVYRFYVLDDVAGGDGQFQPFLPNDVDGIRDEMLNTMMQFPTRIFIDYKQGQFVANFAPLWVRLTRDETEFGWGGPYINYARLRDVDSNDLPEDPWGEEYLLFTPLGWVNQYTGTVESVYWFFAADVGTTIPVFAPFFDRFTVLSKGPNRVPGDGNWRTPWLFGTDDDLKRQF
jgi:prepilin-type N-terminal cleavage/methylation domain-containing protein